MLRVAEVKEREDHALRRLYRLEEGSESGTFVISMFALNAPNARRGNRRTIVVEAEKLGVDVDQAVHSIDTPRLVRNILNRTPVHDGIATLSAEPITIHTEDVPHLVEVIQDPERVCSVVVGGSLASEADHRWRTLMKNLTPEIAGNAAIYSVKADAVPVLNAVLPDSHQVLPGRVRTFMPRTDLDSPDDGLRHRYLGPQILFESIRNKSLSVERRTRHRHAVPTRRRFLEQDLPSDVRRGMQLLIAEDFRLDRDARTEAAVEAAEREALPQPHGSPQDVPVDEPAAPPKLPHEAASAPVHEVLSRLRALLSRVAEPSSDPDPVHALEQVILTVKAEEKRARASALVAAEQADELLEESARLEDAYSELAARLEDVELEAAIEAEAADDALRRASYYRRKLIELQHYEALSEPQAAGDWDAPTSIEDLLDRLTSGEHSVSRVVEFTGDPDTTLDVQDRDPFGRYAARFWEYCHVLHDYALAKRNGFAGNVHLYLTDDSVIGTKCVPDRHASTESETTQNQWGSERVFPIPKSVAREGKVHMFAHFKPTHDSQFAPRMHYYDDTDGSGRVYIGYIGRHLTNTRT